MGRVTIAGAERPRPAGQAARLGADGLRERKKRATRHALGIAAMRLAVERGLENVLVEDIAAAAGVSPRTFSNYFAGKHQAICALAMDRWLATGDALRARPPGEPLLEAITHAVLAPYGAGDQPPDLAWIEGVRLVASSPTLQGEYLRTMHAGQQALADAIADRTGAARAGLLPAVLAAAVTGATQVAMERWLLASPPVPLAPLIRRALGHVSCALADPPGHAESEFGCVPGPHRRC